MFRTTLRLFSSHVIKCHACPTICTLSALDAALKMRFPKHATRHVSSAVPAVPATQNDDGGHQSSAPVNATHLLKTTQKNCTCHTLSTRYKTCWNVTKSHAAHAKRSYKYATIETSKSNHSCRTGQRHGQTRTVANSCRRLRTVANGCERLRHVYRIHPQHPDPQSDTGTLATHTGTRYFAKPRIARDAKEDSAIVFFARLKAASSV